MKIPLIASGIVAAILVLLALVGPSFIDWTKYRTEISGAVYQLTGRQVAIGGDITFRILPTPALKARDIRLSNVEGGVAENFLELDGLDVKLDLFALLMGKVEVTSIVLEHPRFALERDAEGRGNWEFQPDAEDDADEEEPGGLRFHRFAIQDGSITYSDAATGHAEEISSISANILAETENGPFAIDGGLIYRDVAIIIDATTGRIVEGAPIPLRAKLILGGQSPGLTFTGTVSDLLADGSTDTGDGDDPPGAGPATRPSIAGRIKGGGADFGAFVAALARLGEDSPGEDSFAAPVRLDQAFEVDAEIVASETEGTISALNFKIGGSAVEGELAYTVGEVKTVVVTLAVNTVKLEDWLPATKSEPQSSTKIAFPTDVEATVNLSVAAVEYNGGVVRQVNFAGGMSGGEIAVDDLRALLPGGSDIVLVGVASTTTGQPVFEGRVRAGSNNLRALLTWLDIDTSSVPDGQLTTFSLDGGFRASAELVQVFDAVSALDITKASGAVGIRFGDRPSYMVDISIDRLNIDSYFPPGEKAAPGDWAAQRQAIIDALAPLGGFDGSIKLRADQVTASRASIAGLNIDGTLSGGILSLARFSASSFEATRVGIRGRISGLGAAPSFDISLDLESRGTGRIIRWAGLADGMGDITPEALAVVSVSGSVSGTLDNINVDLSGRAMGGSFVLAGALSDLSPTPGSINVTFELAHADHHDLVSRLALDFGLVGASQPVRLSGQVAGAIDDLTGKLHVEALGGSADVDGRVAGSDVTRSFDIVLGVNHGDMTALVRALGQEFNPSVAQLGPVDVGFRLTGTAKTYAISGLQARLGPATISGDLKVDHIDERARITGTINAGRIATDAYMPVPVAGAQQAASAGGQRWSSAPFELESLRDFDLDIKLAAEAVISGAYVLEGLRTTIKLNDGVLALPDFRAGLFGGSLAAAMFLDINDVPALTLQFDIQRAQSAGLLQAAAFIRPLAGRMDVSGRFTAEGDNQQALITTLGGTADIVIDQGRLLGLAAPLLFASATQQCNPINIGTLISGALGAGETKFQNITAHIVVENGVARYADVKASVAAINLTSEGEVNLPAWTMAISGEIRSADMPDAPPVPYEIAGDIDNPRKTFQTTDLKAYSAEQAAANPEGAACAGGGLANPLGKLLGNILPSTSTTSREGGASSGEDLLIRALGGLLGKKSPAKEDDEPAADDEDPPLNFR